MGMYTGIRFKGIVKPEFREEFGGIAIDGNWKDSKDSTLQAFSKVERSSFIPCGGLSYMPGEWEDRRNADEYGHGAVATDGFERAYDKDTGYWAFQCSLKNYSDTIYDFLLLLPYFIEAVEHMEVYYEEWDWSERYELVDGKMVMTTDKFVQYNPFEGF